MGVIQARIGGGAVAANIGFVAILPFFIPLMATCQRRRY